MNRVFAILCINVMSIFSAQAQNDIHLSRQSLAEQGFENISVVVGSDTVFAVIEDPSYRGTFRGPAEALRLLQKSNPECSHYELSVLENGASKIGVHAVCNSGKWIVNVDYDVKGVNDRMKNDRQPYSKCYGKVDVNLIPIFTINNHRYDMLCEFGAFFAPSIEMCLWKGNRFTVQPIIPIYTNLDKTDANRNLRLGVASISQDLFYSGRWTGKVAAGVFYPRYAGFYGELGYHVNANLDIGAHVGYAYTSFFYDDKWYIGEPTVLTTMAKVSYYEPWSSFQLQAQAGRFCYGDWGVRVDLTRHFGEYAIGLYGILTGGEHNGGFHFAIPFGGKRQRRKGVIRVKLPDYYDMQYSMVSYWRYALENMGQEMEEIPDKNHSAHYWQADYIEKYMQKYLDGTFE